ncbi:MAG: DUF2062 domain-containing protein [Rhodocyclaceae bacterium]|nr:DUF2062 domain-containing protein [Rhodocyclaceae bacterium]
MKKLFKRYLPDHTAVRNNRCLAIFGESLLHPRLWHLNRHSAAGAVAAGLFCGMLPAPFQMLTAAICAVKFRVNLPLAILTTLYTNPLTIIPLYVVAFEIGKFILDMMGLEGSGRFVAPPEFSITNMGPWLSTAAHWLMNLGRSLAVGIVVFGAALAVIGYFAVHCLWRFGLIRAWRARAAKRG